MVNSSDPRHRTLNIGLTGNIAAGKSTVTDLFRGWGATILDADQLVRESQVPGSPVLARIVAEFGAGILRSDGSLDRPALRALVLADPAARTALEAIVHPAVQRRREALLDEARRRGDSIVVNDIPLLFEALDPREFDAVILVDAPNAIRIDRLIRGRSIAPAEAERLLEAQMPSALKRPISDYIIENDADRATLESRARAVWNTLQARADEFGTRAP